MYPDYNVSDSWCKHIPLLHRTLADPSFINDFPGMRTLDSLNEACSYWETLHYLFPALLGWKNPGAGLAWWYKQDQPVDDSPLLRTVSDLWNTEGQLDYYAAWIWTHGSGIFLPANSRAEDHAEISLFNSLEWWRAFVNRPEPEWHNPFYGGTNPLHLGHSDSFGFDETSSDRSELYFDVTKRSAVLIVNNLGSWRQDLTGVQEKLPGLGERSWHVNVYDRQYGFLGLFRQSRETGLWFQGKHNVHIKGNQG